MTASVVARGRVSNDAAGFAALLTLLAEAGDSAEDPIPVGDRNRPRPVRRGVARDRPGDLSDQPAGGLALSGPVLGVGGQIRCHRRGAAGQHRAHRRRRAPPIARRHRTGPGDPGAGPRPAGRGVGTSAIGNQIRALLKDFYPAALVAFADLPDGGLARADARTILAAAPTPTQAAKLTRRGCADC